LHVDDGIGWASNKALRKKIEDWLENLSAVPSALLAFRDAALPYAHRIKVLHATRTYSTLPETAPLEARERYPNIMTILGVNLLLTATYYYPLPTTDRYLQLPATYY
jgi:hypothetical protein